MLTVECGGVVLCEQVCRTRRMSLRVAFSRNKGTVWLCWLVSEVDQGALPTYYIICLVLVLVLV